MLYTSRNRLRLLMAFLLLGLCACSATPRVSVDYNQEYHFNTIKSYYLLSQTESEGGEAAILTLNDQRVQAALENEMSARGVQAGNKDEADIWLMYTLVSRDRTRITAVNRYWGYISWHSPFYPGIGPEVDIQEYTEGSLVIDLVDPKTRKVVWRGISTAVTRNRSVEYGDAAIPKHVAAIINEIPGFRRAE